MPRNGRPTGNGTAGKALTFDGANDIAVTPLGSIMSTSNAPWTVQVIYNCPDTGGPVFGITDTPPSSGNAVSLMSIDNTGWLRATIPGGAAIAANPTTDGAGFGHWVNAVLSYSPTAGEKLYINGTLRASSANGTYNRISALPIFFTTYMTGSKPDNVPIYYKGKIDELKIFDRALTDSEVAELAGTGNSNTFTTYSMVPLTPNTTYYAPASGQKRQR